MSQMGHNSASAEKLRSYVERMEYLGSQKSELSDDQRAVMAEAKAEGYDPKTIRKICKIRAKTPSDNAEEEALLSTYRHALGMGQDLPLFRHLDAAAVDITKRDEVIEALKQVVPSNGSIQVETADGKPVRLTRDKDGNVHMQEIMLKPAGEPGARPDGAPAPAGATKREIPDVTEREAEDLGRKAHRENEPVIANPFPFGDKRRARWDQGWRAASGTDGMGSAPKKGGKK